MSKKYESDSLGQRMKGYESTTQTHLLKRTPVIIRMDGKAFHTFTKRLKHVDPAMVDTPFSPLMHGAMSATTDWLFRNVQNCVLAYTQSDEISLLLRDWDEHETQQWFGGNVQKMVSTSASIASSAFNYLYSTNVKTPEWIGDLAYFDSRVYNIPKEEVTNYFIWRQQDASRNSVQMLGHFHFSQKEMHGKNNSEVQDMLMLQKGVNWNDIPTWAKRGSCVVANPKVYDSSTPTFIDREIPIFTQDRFYVERHLMTPDEQDLNAAAKLAFAAITEEMI
jgi:tRNA(His) 5'-end guanylyltransferase